MKKIIHLSDLHIGIKNADKNFENIISNLKTTSKVIPKSTVIVVTGDLAHNAKEDDYNNIRDKFNELKLLGYKIVIVPGNHDFRSEKNKRVIVPGNHGFRNEQNKRYKPSNIALFNKILLGEKCIKYPRVEYSDEELETDNDRIAFILLDSMKGRFEEEQSFKSGKLGKFGDLQLTALDKEILSMDKKVATSKKRVIVFHHHPFRGKPDKLDDEIGLKDILEKHSKNGLSFDALLYGHNHKGKSDREWNIVRCYDGSSSTGKNGDKYPILQRIINLDDIDTNNDQSGDFHIL